MATYEFSAPFTTPGTSASITLWFHLNLSQSQAGNYSDLAWTLFMEKGSAGYPYRANNDCYALARINDVVYEAGNLNYNFPSGPYTITVASGTKRINHDAAGNATVTLDAYYDGKTPIGVADLWSPYGYLALPRIPKPTTAPGTPALTDVEVTSLRADWSAPGNTNGAAVVEYEVRISTSSSMDGATTYSTGTNRFKEFEDLTPGVRHYVDVRARNAAGWSDRSAVSNAMTLAGGRVKVDTWRTAVPWVQSGGARRLRAWVKQAGVWKNTR